MTRRRRREKRRKRRREQRQRRGQTGVTKLRVMPDLLGGLGNQLFVLAACFWYAREHGGTVVLDKAQMKIRSYGAPRPSYADTVFRGFPGVGRMAFQNVPQASVWKAPPSPSVRLTKGYYQDVGMAPFLASRTDLIASLSLPGLDGEMEHVGHLAVHVRFPDKSTTAPRNGDFGCISRDHELTMMTRYVADELAQGHRVSVFSNVPSRVESVFPQGVCVVRGRTEVEDIVALARFRRIIVPPSTFSIWAVYLRDEPKTVYTAFGPQDHVRAQSLRHLRDMPWVTVEELGPGLASEG